MAAKPLALLKTTNQQQAGSRGVREPCGLRRTGSELTPIANKKSRRGFPAGRNSRVSIS
jgi:hypothetical protein